MQTTVTALFGFSLNNVGLDRMRGSFLTTQNLGLGLRLRQRGQQSAAARTWLVPSLPAFADRLVTTDDEENAA